VDFGLSTSDPSGGVNNAAALQAALNAAGAAGRGIVYIPAGTYSIFSTILLFNDPPNYTFPDGAVVSLAPHQR
jgi:Pectate lyase superfamily protein